MTIAIGLLCKHGAVLCADSEMTGDTLKTHEPKLGTILFPSGRVHYAVIGTVHYAQACIQQIIAGVNRWCQSLVSVTLAEDRSGTSRSILKRRPRPNLKQAVDTNL